MRGGRAPSAKQRAHTVIAKRRMWGKTKPPKGPQVPGVSWWIGLDPPAFYAEAAKRFPLDGR